MNTRYFLTSITRIADLPGHGFQVEKLPREQWATGDYVAAEVRGQPTPLYRLELRTGRMVDVVEGDLLVGAFGKRAATLEGVGDWEEIGPDGAMHALTGAGLLGRLTSASALLPRLTALRYIGHVTRSGRKLNMKDCVERLPLRRLDMPVVVLVGTSMSAGKTTAGRIIIRELNRAGVKVVGAKLTGAARYRDTLSFADAGAEQVFDFVDVGLASTLCPVDEFRDALGQLLTRIASVRADVLVAEAGASPLEPYNGATAIEQIRDHVRCMVLCASDPYAVVGVRNAFAISPDLVTGPAANTDAAIALVEKLTGVPALNLIEKSALPALRAVLDKKLGLGGRVADAKPGAARDPESP